MLHARTEMYSNKQCANRSIRRVTTGKYVSNLARMSHPTYRTHPRVVRVRTHTHTINRHQPHTHTHKTHKTHRELFHSKMHTTHSHHHHYAQRAIARVPSLAVYTHIYTLSHSGLVAGQRARVFRVGKVFRDFTVSCFQHAHHHHIQQPAHRRQCRSIRRINHLSVWACVCVQARTSITHPCAIQSVRVAWHDVY